MSAPQTIMEQIRKNPGEPVCETCSAWESLRKPTSNPADFDFENYRGKCAHIDRITKWDATCGWYESPTVV